MKILIAFIMTAMITMSPAGEPEYFKGEVISFVARTPQSERGKSVVVVWNGKKGVGVTLPTNYLHKVIPGKVFPYKITRDRKTGRWVSAGTHRL